MEDSVVKKAPLPPKPAPKPGKVKVMRALYNYTAQYPDELSFTEGDVLYVYDQVSDPNWWKARCGDKTGLIPSNYVETQTEEVELPLHEAARRGNLSFLKECLQQGVSGTALDRAHNTPLYWASHAGHIECVTELLSLSSPAVNAQNKLGDSPLHAAASRSHLKIVELLLQCGADPNLHNNDGQTPLELAMNPAVRNVLQANMTPRARSSDVTYAAAEYDGGEDSD